MLCVFVCVFFFGPCRLWRCWPLGALLGSGRARWVPVGVCVRFSVGVALCCVFC